MCGNANVSRSGNHYYQNQEGTEKKRDKDREWEKRMGTKKSVNRKYSSLSERICWFEEKRDGES